MGVLFAAEIVEQNLERGAEVAAAKMLPRPVDEQRYALGERRLSDRNVGQALGEAREGIVEHREQQLVLAILLELAHCLCEPVLERPHALLVALHERARERARE